MSVTEKRSSTSHVLSFKKPSIFNFRGDLSVQGFLAVDVTGLGTLSNAFLTGSFKKSNSNSNSSLAGSVKLTGVSSFYFTNIPTVLPIPTKGKPPFNAILRPAKIVLTGNIDTNGQFLGNATIQVVGGKGFRPEKLTLNVKALVSP